MAKPCSWQKCRRTAASVSLKVGRRLRYQAALITAPRAFGLSCAASKVTRENSPSRQGVVRAMARSDHWRWVSTPRCARVSWNVVESSVGELMLLEIAPASGFTYEIALVAKPARQ